MPGSRPSHTWLAGAIIALTCSASLALTGCGPLSESSSAESTPASAASAACQQVGTVKFDKTKLLFHAGLAYGAFHHFILKPFRSGAFAHGAKGRFFALGKAGLAGLFTVHELKLVKQDAESSPTLCHLVAPLDEAAAALSGMQHKVQDGSVTQQDLDGVDGKLTSAQQTAQQAGVPISDQIPSDAQLANPSGSN